MRLQQYLNDFASLSDDYINQKLEEAVIYVNIESYLELFEEVIQDITMYDANEQLLERLNTKFYHRKILFRVKNNKFGAFTDRYGTIYINVTDNFIDKCLYSLNSVKKWLTSILEHELIHREQSKKVSFDFYYNKNYPKAPKDKQTHKKYLSHKHEIMSYARNIITQLQNQLYFDGKVLEFLRAPKPGKSKILDEYINTFGKNSETIKRLYKYMYEYLIKGN